jgi:Predicted GTPase
MYFDRIPTVPTADELLDRSFRRAAKKMSEKENKQYADIDFVRAITQATHDKLVSIIQSFPEFEELPPFYRDMCDILFGMENLRKNLGMIGWAAKNVRDVGQGISRGMKKADTLVERKRAVARIASIVHRADDALHYMNDVRNVLRKLPAVNSEEFTIAVAGYPNVGKSSLSGLYPQQSRRLPPIRLRPRELLSVTVTRNGVKRFSSSIHRVFWTARRRSAMQSRSRRSMRLCMWQTWLCLSSMQVKTADTQLMRR